MNVFIEELIRREERTEQELKAIRKALSAAREVCKHDYKKIGNTHKDVYECKICGDRMTA